MRFGLLKILFFFLLIPAGLIGRGLPVEPICSLPNMTPTITGPTTVCANGSSYIYYTEPGKQNYVWSVSGGTFIPSMDNDSITVTWNTAGPQTVSVIYDPEITPGVLNVTVLSPVDVGITISASANPVCAGTLVTYTATVTNGGSSPYYQWKVNDIDAGTNSVFSYIPTNNDIVTCKLTSGLICTTVNPVMSNPITMTVNQNLPVSISITASPNPSCAGDLVTFTAVAINGGSAPVYQWKKNGTDAGPNSAIYSYIPVNGDIITCVLTSNETCKSGDPATSNTITMTVSPAQPVSVSIEASANPSCLGDPVIFTPTPVNGGIAPVYEWYVDNSFVGNGATYTYTPINGAIVKCKLISSAGCATGNPANSNEITMVVIPNSPVSIIIAASANPVCQGISVTYTATVVNGGSLPGYEWMVNGYPVDTNDTYTYLPANGAIVTCQLTSNLACATGNPAISNPIIMTVTPSLLASVSITTSSNPACQGTSVQFTAMAMNGGSPPFYQWKINDLNAGINQNTFSYIPGNGDTVTCQITSTVPCNLGSIVTSNEIIMMMSPALPVSVSITASLNPVCQGNSVTFTATPANGGPSPAYQWYVNSIPFGTNVSYTYSPLNGDIVTCQLTSSLGCATGNPAISNAITMIISSTLPVSITITASSNPSCMGQAVLFTATPVNGGTNPQYQWLVNGLIMLSDSATFSYIPTNGALVKCKLTSSLTCATGNPAYSNVINMTVVSNLNVSVTIIPSANPSCQGSTVTFTATAVNGGPTPQYQWKVNGLNVGTGQNPYSYLPVNGDIVTCLLTSSVLCPVSNPVTSNAITMSVLPVLPVGVSISTLTNPSCTGSQVTFTATATNGGTSSAYQWKLNGVNTGAQSPILIFIPVTGDAVSCQFTSNAICYTGNNMVQSNTINMVVSNTLIPGVSIAASTNPFCQGTPVTFTATPMNGGTLPVYQWKVNCANAGTNSPLYTYTPADGDFITCRMTSNLPCAIQNPATSNAITMKKYAGTPVSVQIAPSANPVCQGSVVTFTATAVNGGSTPAYQWKVNGSNKGTNATYSYTPINGEIVTCVLTSNAPCVSGNPATSNAVSMVVSAAMPASISITTPTNPFCEGTFVTFTATVVNGGSAPVYQWKVNGINAGVSTTTYSYIPSSGEIVTCQLTSNSTCISGGNPVTSNPITMVSSTSIPVTVSITSSSNAVCQGTSVSFTATPTNGGNNPTYQWKANGIFAGNGATYSYIPLNGDVITCELTSDLICETGNPALSNSITMTVNPVLPVSVTITASCNPCCQGTPVTFTAVGVNGGSAPAYQWKVNCVNVGTNSTSYNYTPVNGDVVVCVLTSNETCTSGNPAMSNNINMIVMPVLPVSVSITASANPFCTGTPVTFIATASNGGSSPVYQWKVNGVNKGTNNPIYTYTPAPGDTVTCQLTSNQACISNNPAISNKIIMVASSNLAVSVTITASMNPICAGTLVVFKATPTNGGSNPHYQWKVNETNKGNNDSTYQFPPINGDVITCVLTSNLTCATGNPATSNPITMMVYPLKPVSVTITASANPTCVGNTVCFTSDVINGGTAPTYRWRVNGVNFPGATSSTFCYVPVNGDVVYCRVTSNETCASGNPCNSNSITMNVISYSIVSITISASANPVCQGDTVAFSAIPVNGGTDPIYQWKVNGINAGSDSSVYSYVPVNGDVVYCVMTSNAYCVLTNMATSSSITMTVSPSLLVSVSIATPGNPACQGSSVTFTATPVNGGAPPSYQWKVNGIDSGTNSHLFTYVPTAGDVVTCVLTSNATCAQGSPATSNAITMNVSINLLVSVTITASPIPMCQGQVVCYTAVPVNGGPNPSYQWMIGPMPVGPNSPTYCYTPTSGDVVTCQLTSSYTCASGNPALSNPIALTFSPNLLVSITVTCSANPACQGVSVTYTAIVVNGGSAPFYQWKVNGVNIGGNSPIYTYIPLNGDIVTCKVTSNYPCPINNPATSNPITMVVLVPVSAAVSIVVSANPVCTGTPVTFTATPINGGSPPGYQWYKNGLAVVGATLSTYTYIPANGDFVKCQLTSSLTCVNNNPVMSNMITMVVVSDFPVSVTISASPNPACQGQVVTFTETQVNGGTNPLYQWKVGAINVGFNLPTYNYTPTNGDVVTCTVTSSYSCASNNPAVSNQISMIVNPILPVSVSITSSFNPACLGTTVIYTATVVNGGLTPAYQWKVNGVNAGTNLSTFPYIPVNGDIITCQVASNWPCVSGNPAISNQIIMIVGSGFPVSVSIAASANPICVGTSVTFTATPTYGGSFPFYQWKVNGGNAGTNSTTFTYFPNEGDIVTCTLTSDLTCAAGNPATSNPITMAVLPVPVGISIEAAPTGNVCAGDYVTFTATPQNGGANPNYKWKVNGILAGTNNPVFCYQPVNGDIVTCVLTSNATCASGNTATSNPIAMIVTPLMPVSVLISANPSGFVCTGTQVTYTAVAINGGSAPVYQWKVNGVNAGTNSTIYTYFPVDGDMITCTVTSNLTCATGNPAISNSITMTVLFVPIGVSITANPATAVCAGTYVTFTAIPLNGGSSPTFSWKVNGIDAGMDNSTFSYPPANGDIVTCILASNATCAAGNTVTSNPITMVVNPILPVSIAITASVNPVCMGVPVIFTAATINGGSAPVYLWKVNGIDAGSNTPAYSYTPLNGDVITCILTSNATCASGSPATSNAITITINPNLPVSVSIGANPSGPICQGIVVTFTGTAVNGGSVPGYQWKVNGVDAGTNNSSYSYSPSNGDMISCILTSNAICATGNPATSNAIAMTVNPNLTVSIGIAANPFGAICEGTVVTFTGTPINGGSTPVYHWKVNGTDAGTNSSTYMYIPVNGDIVLCILTSDATCPTGNPTTSNTIAMNVNQLLPVSALITSDPSGVLCEGTQATYTAVSFNGGSSPSFQWKVNGLNTGDNAITFNYTPLNGDVITCILTSNATCATGNPTISNEITMTINPILPVSIGILSNPPGAICEGTAVTFTGTAINGGSTPIYQWKVNGTDVGTNNSMYNYIPANGDMISCILTSNVTCTTGNPATSNTIAMVVNPNLPVSIGITSNPSGAVCTGTSVTFTGTAINGGSAPVYLWKINGIDAGSNSPAYSYPPLNGDVITCILTSNATCASGSPATSNAITIAISPNLPVSVSIAANPSGAVCEGTTVTFTGTAVNGGSVPVYQWKVNGINAGTNNSSYSYAPLNGDMISCILTSNETCATGSPATSNAIGMIVNQNLPVSIGITANPPGAVCAGTAVTFTGTAINGGSTPVYQWKVNGSDVGTNNSIYTYIPVNGDIVSCILTSDATCPTGNPATSNTIAMVVNPLMPVGLSIAASANPVCEGIPVMFTATAINGGSAPVYQWKVNGADVGSNSSAYGYTPLNGDVITCILTSNATCASGSPATSNEITITTNPNLPVSIGITANPSGSVCEGTTVTFTGTAVNGGSVPVYQWKVNGFDAGTNISTFSYAPSNGDMISCLLTSNASCATGNPSNSNTIAMIVNPNLPVSIDINVDPSGNICEGTIVTFTGAAINGGTAPAYQWQVNAVNAGSNMADFTYTPINGDVITCIVTSNEICTSGNPATSNPITMSVAAMPVVTFSLCVDPVTTTIAKPIKLKGGIPLGGTYSGPGVNSSTGIFSPSLAGAGTHQLTYTYDNNASCSASAFLTIVTLTPDPVTCGMDMIDPRDGRVYPTVLAGTQCWFAKNLNYGQQISSSETQRDNCQVEKYCSNDEVSLCISFGGFYHWDEMMQYDDQETAQGLCPPGWHVPGEEEWNILFNGFSGGAYAGDPLKSGGSSGFNALLAGGFFKNRSWAFNDLGGFFWSSTTQGSMKAWAHGMNKNNHGVSFYPSSRSNAYSVRCLKD